MKKELLIIILLLIPGVLGFIPENYDIIETPISIQWNKIDAYEGEFIVSGENYVKKFKVAFDNTTINSSVEGLPEDWEDVGEIKLVREVGNWTEQKRILANCEKMTNFTGKWEECLEINQRLHLSISDKINLSEHEKVIANLTEDLEEWKSKVSSKEEKISEMENDIEESENRSSRWKLIGVVLGGIVLFIVIKFGFLGRKHQMDEEKISDVRT